MITLTSDQRAALGKRHIVRRTFFWCDATDDLGSPDPAGFWDDVGNVEFNGKIYYGSGGVIQVETVSAKSDLTIPGLTITLNGLNDEAIDLVRARIKGQEPVSVSFGIFDTDTRDLIGSLVPIFVGFIDDIDFPNPAAGGDSVIRFICESTSRALTVSRTDTRSDGSLKQRASFDNFYKYTGLQREKPLYFGRQGT